MDSPCKELLCMGSAQAGNSASLLALPLSYLDQASAILCLNRADLRSRCRVPWAAPPIFCLALTPRAHSYLPPTGLQAEHGPKLVPLVLGLLAVRRGGLSAGTLLDAVSASDDVMGAKGQEGTVMQHTGAWRARAGGSGWRGGEKMKALPVSTNGSLSLG